MELRLGVGRAAWLTDGVAPLEAPGLPARHRHTKVVPPRVTPECSHHPPRNVARRVDTAHRRMPLEIYNVMNARHVVWPPCCPAQGVACVNCKYLVVLVSQLKERQQARRVGVASALDRPRPLVGHLHHERVAIWQAPPRVAAELACVEQRPKPLRLADQVQSPLGKPPQ